ncbi:unnamed protein product [Paramecium sonneborni]|uniref:Uncharacterized protein n=1 Tax=Paramecium sonneborni TaxID=65129 RepID=A0A8S1RPL2_9CILI|nr:unnamed protein product [Paramecium sonneborni]
MFGKQKGIDVTLELEGKQQQFNSMLGFLYEKTTFSIKFRDGQRMYIKDGCVIRQDTTKYPDHKQEVYRNFEQAQFLVWNGKYGRDDKKIGKWSAFWMEDDKIKVGGGWFDNNGQKYGKWIELSENYSKVSKLTYVGQYNNGIRIGQWDIYYNDTIIGLGVYNQKGMKNGEWTILHENFWNRCQIIYIGQFLDGKRISEWKTFYRFSYKDSFNFFSSGQYNQSGKKIGEWNEFDENFWHDHEVISCGKYDSGKKIGKWIIKFRNFFYEQFQIIGGGNYDENGKKIGKWIELSEYFLSNCQTFLIGEYENGKRVGKWELYFQQNSKKEYKRKKNLIGGGVYDKNGIKDGKWIELYGSNLIETFTLCSVFYQGSYIKGQRVGKWEIFQNSQKIGGGVYEQPDIKTGPWIEIHNNYCNECRVFYTGEYKDGWKIGKWSTLDHYDYILGGGKYNNQGLKIGKWIEICENYDEEYQIYQVGEFKNGIKIGKWEIFSKKRLDTQYKTIGGGQYNEKGQKNGQWIDILSYQNDPQKILLIGQYKNGLKLGQFIRENLN